ncbi:hypothetical protein ACXNAL_18645 [Kluyvera ascorbata]
MNDITVLMATIKAAVEKAKHAGEAQIMPFDTRISALNEFQLAACPDNVLALVEALELSHRYIERLRKWNANLAHESCEYQNRITSLESRTVTVKLPSLKQTESGERYVWSDGVHNFKADVIEILRAAGIQVIKGEQKNG